MPDFLGSKISLIVLAMVYLAACVTGEGERKSPLNVLNADHYQSAPMVGYDGVVIPILKRKDKLTTVSGRLVVGEALNEVPLKFQKIQILKGKNTMSEITTDANGNFVFNAALANGKYSLFLPSKKYIANASIEVQSYEIKNLVVQAKPLP